MMLVYALKCNIKRSIEVVDYQEKFIWKLCFRLRIFYLKLFEIVR